MDRLMRSFPMISFRTAVWLGGAILAIDAAAILLIKDDWARILFSDLIIPIANLLAVAALFYAAQYSARSVPRFAPAWYLWMTALIVYTIASITWAIYELILGEPPFPSLADVFYLSYYVFIWLGLARYPKEGIQIGGRKLMLLDNVIVVLGAGLSFWVLLFIPFLNTDEFSLTTLLEIAYPVMGMISVWGLMIFFRNLISQSESIPLLFIGMGFIFEIVADVLFAYQSLNSTFMSGNWGDLFFVGSSMALMLAGVRFVSSYSLEVGNTQKNPSMFLPEYFSKQWPIYLPYFWLVLAYAILIHSFVVNDIDIPQFIVIGIVIGLVILRQVLTFNDNERLHGQALKELKGRKRTEEELRQLNQNLDKRVEQRTNELRIANDLLVVYNQKMEGSLREKEVLIKEIHHRVKNNLQTVSSLLSLQTRLVEDPVGRSALKDSQMRVRSMALIHEKLYQSDNLRDIDLRPYIENLCVVLFQSYQTDKRHIQMVTQVENLTVGIDVAIPLGLIINELISNALKHAFPGGRSGTIQMTLNSSHSGNMTLKCQDDGCGMPDSVDFSMSKSLGLQLVHNLTRQLDGGIEICSQNGLGVTISIPLQAVRDQKLPDRSETGELVL